MLRGFVNRSRGALSTSHDRRPPALVFHQRLPGYTPTPLRSLPGLAARLGIGELLVKDETRRLGLPSFKVLGTGWAAYRALTARNGEPAPWRSLDDLRRDFATRPAVTLVTATDGNHGHALAWFAAQVGLPAHIVVPPGVAEARIAAIEALGAVVTRIDGSYDDAVQAAGALADRTHLVVSDTTWDGHEETARWVVDGYATIMWEIEAELAARGPDGSVDAIVVQVGVGGLAAAVARHARAVMDPVRLISVEPLGAECVLASVEAGKPVARPGPHPSHMVGLNCDLPSLVAWPDLVAGFDVFLAIGDDAADEAIDLAAQEGLVLGESGAAGIGALLALADAEPELRAAAGLSAEARVLTFATEGPTGRRSRGDCNP